MTDDRDSRRAFGEGIDEAQTRALTSAIHSLRMDMDVPGDWRRTLLERVEIAKRRRRVQRRLVAATGVAAAAVVCFAIATGSTHLPRTAGNDPVHFEVSAPAARRVSLVGDFDGWNPAALPMRRVANGAAWSIDVHLPAGRHAFAYSVDGRLTIDSTAALAVDDNFGVPNSVIVVSPPGSN
jgi:hypothetical protein